MRVRRVLSAAVFAVLAYAAGLTAAAPIQHSSLATKVLQPVVGVAYADAAGDFCNGQFADKGQASSCAIGYHAGEKVSAGTSSQSANDACANASDQNACSTGFMQAGGAPSGAGVDQDKCAASLKSFAWLACPLFDDTVHFFATTAKDLIQQFMAVQPLTMSGSLYNTWVGVRSLADLVFVLVFMFLIIAHIGNINVDSYTLKKMIPKLAAAAILVQFSYVLASVIVDVGNILGQGVGMLLNSVTNGGHPEAASVGSITENVIDIIVGVGLIGGLASIAITGLTLAMPIFIIVLITALAFIATLAFRYFLIGILIVTAPLALVAWILPNTEKYFNQWLGMFIKLILMYPIIVGLLSVAADVGGLIPNTTSAAGATGQLGQSVTTTVIKLLIVAGCFMQVPRTFQWAGGLMNEVHGRMTDLNKKAAKGYWDSSGVGAKRKNVRSALIRKADSMKEGFEHAEGKYAWLGKGPAKHLPKGFRGPATLLFTGQSGDLSTRQFGYGHIVEEHAKTIGTFDQSKDSHALESALTHHYVSERLRTGAYKNEQERDQLQVQLTNSSDYLAKSESKFLLDFTGTAERREAMMHILGERNQLKMPMQHHIQRLQDETKDPSELGAFIRQDFTNYAKQPAIAGITTDGAVKPQVNDLLKNITANDIKGPNFQNRNFQVAASRNTAMEVKQAKAFAEAMANNLVGATLRTNFKKDDRDAMSSDKQALMLLTMARNQDVFSSEKGKAIKTEIVNQIMHDMNESNGTSHREMLWQFEDYLKAQGDYDKIEEYRQFLSDVEWTARNRQAGGELQWQRSGSAAPTDEDLEP